MLQTDKLSKDTVYTFKLATGEEMVAKFLRSEDGNYYVSHPLVLGMQQVQNPETGQVGQQIGFMPFAVTLNPDIIKEIPINISNIVTYFEPPKDISDGYLQQTSGIQLATAGSV
jgi:hypothetical protein